QAERMRFAPDLMKDPAIRVIDKLFVLWLVLGLVIPFGLGWAIGGTLGTALTCLLWGGLVRIFMLQHVTWSINSICHFFGRRRFDVDDESRNVAWLAPFSLGEGWHHNHHAFPTSAFHGLKFWEKMSDPTGLLIALLERLGLVWNVVRVSPEKQTAKLAVAAQAAKGAAASARASAAANAKSAAAGMSTAASNARSAAADKANAAADRATAAAANARSAASNAKQAATTAAQNAAQAASSGATVSPASSSISQ
ncbi:MAG TPA: fatty acid desaturase, partial [Chloroflexota bacterium]